MSVRALDSATSIVSDRLLRASGRLSTRMATSLFCSRSSAEASAAILAVGAFIGGFRAWSCRTLIRSWAHARLGTRPGSYALATVWSNDEQNRNHRQARQAMVGTGHARKRC